MVELADTLEGLWTDLTRDLGLRVQRIREGDLLTGWPNAVAAVLSAGGQERAAIDWLGSHERPRDLPVFVVGTDDARRLAIQVVRQGADDYLALPEDLELLSNAVAAATRRWREAQRRSQEGHAVGASAFAAILGGSPALRAVLERAGRILPHADATVLILGATGTGKELLARALHDGGPNGAGPFVAVNCSALPAQLIESELFGHERGAFTNAHAAKPGLFEVADGGTLFLDEVGTLPLDLQTKLLRVLDDRQVRRVGGTKSRAVNVRIIAATNENLMQAVRDRSFREDLYYRLNVVTLALPPLRERGRDVVLIAEAVLQRLAKRHGLPLPRLSSDARSKLLAHHWPGNVRELKNAVERALWLSPPGELDLSEMVPAGPTERTGGGAIPFPAPLRTVVLAAARATVERCQGNRSEAARQLGISRRRLTRLLGEHVSSTQGQEESND